MSNKREVMFYATKERKPIVGGGTVTMPDGSEIEFKSRNEYKAWRRMMKQELNKMRKAGK